MKCRLRSRPAQQRYSKLEFSRYRVQIPQEIKCLLGIIKKILCQMVIQRLVDPNLCSGVSLYVVIQSL